MPTHEQAEENDWQKIWDARIAGLTSVLGKPADRVYHAAMPIHLGGFADVLPFPSYVAGMTYVTADLTGEDVGQIPSSLGNYELMICAHEELPQAASMISRLARYTTEAKMEPGETMDLPNFFSGSIIKALLFTCPGEKPLEFEFLGNRYGLLLCVGITEAELAFKRASGSDQLTTLLRQRGIFPYTVLQRESVTP